MLGRMRTARDPWWDDGQGAKKAHTRVRVTGFLAFALSIAACGLTAAAWILTILPAIGGSPLG